MKRILAIAATALLAAAGVVFAAVPASAAGVVHGTITAEDGVTPISGAALTFSYVQGDATGSVTATTNAAGGFVVQLAALSYTVRIAAEGYATEYWDDVPLRADASPFVVADGGDHVLDASLGDGSVIEGTLTGPGGPLPNTQVSLRTPNTGSSAPLSVLTDANGLYRFTSLAVGDYTVFTVLPDDSALVDEWFDDQPSQATATPVTVTADGSTVTADFDLAEGGVISGTVRNELGHPIETDVLAEGVDVPYERVAVTAPDGSYELVGLRDQAYELALDDEFFEIAPQAVTVASAQTVPDVNLVVRPIIQGEEAFDTQLTPMSGPATVQAGSAATWTVEVDQPGDIYAVLYSEPVYLGVAESDANGVLQLTVTIPADTPPGVHRLMLMSAEDEKEHDYLQFQVTEAALAATGAPLPLSVLAGALLVMSAGGLLLLRRRIA